MKKVLFLIILISSWHLNAQVFIQEDFDSGIPTGWDIGTYEMADSGNCSGGSLLHNMWDLEDITNTSTYSETATGNDIVISFDYKIIDYYTDQGVDYDFGVFYLQFSIDGGATWINYDTINGLKHVISDVCNTWTNTILASEVPNGSDFAWKIDGTWTQEDYLVFIDNFSAIEQVNCFKVTNLSVTNETANSADLSWNSNGSESIWNIEYGEAGFPKGTGTLETGITNPYTLSGLNPEIDYEFYVQADCGGTDQSGWAGPYLFSTLSNCPAPTDLSVTNVSSNSADFGWTENGNATLWNIEYGEAGFTPGNGVVVTGVTNPYTATGLDAQTDYEFYVQGDCGNGEISPWSLSSGMFLTSCISFEANGFCEDFESTNSSSLSCWRVFDINEDGESWTIISDQPNNGDYSASFDSYWSGGDDDDYLVTPPLNFTGVEFMKFSYSVEDEYEPIGFQVLLSTTGNSPSDFKDTLMRYAVYTNQSYMDTIIDLTAYTGTVYVAFNMISTTTEGVLFIDDVCFGECIPTPGNGGAIDVCRTVGQLNLADEVIAHSNNAGRWEFPENQTLIVNDTLFNVSFINAGSYELLYIVDGMCTSDTTIAVVTVYSESSAGVGSTITVCKEEPINLFSALSGTVDLGGAWYDSMDNPLPNSQPIASNEIGEYHFKYVANNVVCIADTAFVQVIVTNCYWNTEAESFADISVYPNPVNNVLNIANPSNISSLKIEVLDINGRIVWAENQELSDGTNTVIEMSYLENGIYTLRVHNEEGQRNFKIIKQ